jgi:hypothetical protein
MQNWLRRPPLKLLCALAVFAFLSGCGGDDANFVDSDVVFQAAISKLRGAIGVHPRVLKVEIEPDSVAIEAQDPHNLQHVDRWRYEKYALGPVAFALLASPEPVELQLLNPDLEANLFDLDAIDFSQAPKLKAAAAKRVRMQEPGHVTRMEIARQTFILPAPSSGDIRWTLRVESGRERAEVVANAKGDIVRLHLGETLRAQTLNLFNEPDLAAAAAKDFHDVVGAGPVLRKVEVDAKTISFSTTIRDTTFGKSKSGLPSLASFTWDLDGLVRRLGVVDVHAAMKQQGPPTFSVDEVDWSIVGRLQADALAKVATPRARVTEVSVEKSTEYAGAPVIAWAVQVTDPDDEKTTVYADAGGAIRRVELPESRRPKVDWLNPAAFAGVIAQLESTFGAETQVAEISVNGDAGRVTVDDAANGGQMATFNFTAHGLLRAPSVFAIRAKDSRFFVKELAFLGEPKLTALEADAMRRLGATKKLYLDSMAIGPHPFAPKAGARAIELRFRDTPEPSPKSSGAWIVYDFNGHVLDFSAP